MRNVLAVGLVLMSTLASALPVFAATPDESAFQRVWARTDAPVATGEIQRTWYWGPAPLITLDEEYLEGIDGLRRVQYWDKGRMEIGNPNDAPDDAWYVSSGLLVKELVSGQVQLGDDEFDRLRSPNIPIAGDPNNNPLAPTYSAWRAVSSINLDTRLSPIIADPIGPVAARNAAPPRYGDLVDELVGPDGDVRETPELAARYPGTRIVYWEGTLSHNIPQVFWEFLQQTGKVQVNGEERLDMLIDWVYVMGYPISEPYWVRTRVNGVEQDVLVQAYERRVLTYTPTNPLAYQVEMGNAGLHYYRWRYEPRPEVAPVGRPDNINATVDPAQAPAGTVFKAQLFGFEPGETVSIWLTLSDQSVIEAPRLATADANGFAVLGENADIFIRTSEGDPVGVWALTGQGNSSGRQAIGYFVVTE